MPSSRGCWRRWRGVRRCPVWPELPAILAQAHGCGALATTAKGAMTALPTRTRLDEFCDRAQATVDLRLEARTDSPTLM